MVTLLLVVGVGSLLVAWLALLGGQAFIDDIRRDRMLQSNIAWTGVYRSPEQVEAWIELNRPTLDSCRTDVDAAGDAGLDGYPAGRIGVAAQIWTGDGRLVLCSAHGPARRLAGFEPGFSTFQDDHVSWETLVTRHAPADLWIMTAMRTDLREEVVRGVMRTVFVPQLLVLPLLAIITWALVSFALLPLRRVQGSVSRRSADALQGIPAERVPVEVRPLVETINDLLSRLAEALTREKRFTADAAHELRTPMAVMSLSAHNALTAGTEAERREDLEMMLGGVERAAHLVEQLLILARVDPGEGAGHQMVDLGAIARVAVAELRASPHRSNHALTAEVPEIACNVIGREAWLHILLSNLVLNAFKYTPAGTPIRVQVSRDGEGVLLAVEDDGPGIPPDQRTTVLERFRRLPGNPAPGAGLGLSIAQRIVEVHGARMHITATAGSDGCRVEVRFPRLKRASDFGGSDEGSSGPG